MCAGCHTHVPGRGDKVEVLRSFTSKMSSLQLSSRVFRGMYDAKCWTVDGEHPRPGGNTKSNDKTISSIQYRTASKNMPNKNIIFGQR